MIGIVTGVAAEADALFSGLGHREHIGQACVRIVEEHGVATICAGIGKVSAALAATMLVERFGARHLMIVGTAGALHALRGPHWLSHAVQHDYGARRSDAFVRYTAGQWPIGPAHIAHFSAVPQPDGLNLPAAVMASGDAFIECSAHAAEISASLGAMMVDMETAAVAQVAAMLGIGWSGIKCPTDDANGESATSFEDNLRAASLAAARAAHLAIDLMRAQAAPAGRAPFASSD